MYYPADPITSEANMAENTNKVYDASNFGDYYDMDTEVNYQDLFSSAEDQAVPDYLTLNTPPVSTSSVHPLSSLPPYMNTTDSTALPTTVSDGYHLAQEAATYYTASHTPSPVPHLPAVPEHEFLHRTPVIVPSATAPEPKPRRKGGRKPKNDPLPPHLEERRRLRRIRNKEAAQKCRERRLAQTDELLQEIDQLEKQTRHYEEFINRMREYKEQCEYVLSSHKTHCNQIAKRRMVTGLTLNTFNNNSCSIAHRRSSSSEGEITSPTFIM